MTLQLPVPPESVILQFVSAPVIATVPVGVVPPVTVTVTFTDCPISDGSGESVVIVVVVGANWTVWLSVSLLGLKAVLSGVYVAVMVLFPTELNTTTQLPVPPESVMVQFVFAPVMATVPVGVEEPVTATLTVTDCPIPEGSGDADRMVVTVSAGDMTTCSSVSLLVEWVLVGLYVAVRVLVPSVPKLTLQFPVPLFRLIVQVGTVPSAPVMVTVPVGVPPQVFAFFTSTSTVTVAPISDGSGVSAVIVVSVVIGTTV